MDYVGSLFAVMVRLQAEMGSEGVRWSGNAARAVGSHMEARYSFIQQVRTNEIFPYIYNLTARPRARHCANRISRVTVLRISTALTAISR